MRENKRKIFAALFAALIAATAAGCHNDSDITDDGLPAAASETTGPTVSYMSEDTTESEEPITFPSSETTKRTAYSETEPELATTTATVTETTTEEGVTTISGVPNVPIGQFTSSTPLDLASAANSSDTSRTESSSPAQTTAPSAGSSSQSGSSISSASETSVTGGTVAKTEPSSGVRPYSYGFLTEKQKYIYDAIISAAEQRSTTIRFSSDMGVTAEDYCGVYQIIYDDEHALFYIDTKMQYAVNSATGNISTATMFYKYSASATDSMQAEIDAAVDGILAMITPDMTDYDKVKLFNDVLASEVVYDEYADNCRDIYGVFVDKKAICGGYSKAFSYLCGKAGIETVTVTGDADGQPHMWNKVKIDGKWYNIDVTYAVPSNSDNKYVRYDYFCVTDEMLSASRTLYDQNYTYPAAVSDDCNYYVKNGLVANSMDEVRKLLKEQIIECSQTKETVVQIKCASAEVYEEAVYCLFDRTQKQALDILDETLDDAYNKYDCSSVNYNYDNTSHVIKLFLVYV